MIPPGVVVTYTIVIYLFNDIFFFSVPIEHCEQTATVLTIEQAVHCTSNYEQGKHYSAIGK